MESDSFLLTGLFELLEWGNRYSQVFRRDGEVRHRFHENERNPLRRGVMVLQRPGRQRGSRPFYVKGVTMKRSRKRASLVGLMVIMLLCPLLCAFVWEVGESSASTRLFVYPQTVDVGTHHSGSVFQQEFTVWNTGTDTLTATVSTDAPCIRVLSHFSFSLEQNEKITLSFLGCYPSEPGEFSGNFTIRSNGGNKTVRFRGVVQRPKPELFLYPERIDLGENPAGKAFQGGLIVKNTGTRTLAGTFSENTPWIMALTSSSFCLGPGEHLALGFLGHFPFFPGEFRGEISVSYDGTSKTVELRGLVQKPKAELSVEPENIYLGEGVPGRPFHGQFVLNNNGTHTMIGSVSKDAPWMRALSHSNFVIPEGQHFPIGFLGHFPSDPGEFTGTIAVRSNRGYRTVKISGNVQDPTFCTVEMPDWLRSGSCPPWIPYSQWRHYIQEDKEAVLDWALETWNTWIQQLTIEGRLCEADIEEYLILVHGLQPLYIVERCFWRRPQYTEPTYDSDLLGYPAYLDWVMWTGAQTENLAWYEVIYDGRIGWMPSSSFGDPFPFDMTKPMVAIPQDPEIAEAARTGPDQFIGVWDVVPRPEDATRTHNCNLCGEFCVAALLGEKVDFRVLNLLRAWTHGNSRAVHFLQIDSGTWRHPDLSDMFDLYDVAYEDLDRHLSCQELEDELHSGKMLIALVMLDCRTGNSCGEVNQRGGEHNHWVIVEDAKATEDGGWIRIYNSYWNREEVYTYEEFDNACHYGSGLWVMPGVRSDGQGSDQETEGIPQTEPAPVQEVDQTDDRSSLGVSLVRVESGYDTAQEEEGHSDQTSLRPAEDLVTASTTHVLVSSGDQGQVVDADEGLVVASEKDTSYEAATAFQSRDVLEPSDGDSEGDIPDSPHLTIPQELSSGVSEEVVTHFYNTAPTTIECVAKLDTVSHEQETVRGESDGADDQAFNAADDPHRDEPKWRRFDLGRKVSMKGIRFAVDRSSYEPIGYQVWVAGNPLSWRLAYEFSAVPLEGEVFEKHFSPPLEVRYVEIRTSGEAAWISDVKVF